jgi:AraC-like DNA-binding protein
MDVLEGLLDGPRARGAFLLRATLDPPWGIKVEDESPLAVIAMTRGWAWIWHKDGTPQRLDAGDVAIARGPDHYVVADDPQTPPDVVVYPGQKCTRIADGQLLEEEWSLGVRTWGPSADGSTVMLIGAYERAGELSRPLLSALPPLVTLRSDEWDSPLVPFLADEITRDSPGQRAVLDRLLDVLLISALRTWFTRQRDDAPAWYRAAGDPVVGKALQLVHHYPDHSWTVASLAEQVGASRAAFARRFTELVGEPPMAYLTSWRLAMAADLLCQPDSTIGAVARRVGYGTAFALSAAFKRERGVSPQQHRELVDVTGPR